MAFEYKAKDGVPRYAKFRLVPADGREETGLLTEYDQRRPWLVLYLNYRIMLYTLPTGVALSLLESVGNHAATATSLNKGLMGRTII